MEATVPHRYATLPAVDFQEHLARITGLLYLVLAAFGMFAPLVLTSLVVPGEPAVTAANISASLGLFGSSLVGWIVIVVVDIAVAATLYLLLEPVSRTISLLAAAIRLVYAAILGAILLNLCDAFQLLSNAGRGAGLDAQQRTSMAVSSIESFSAGFVLALVFFGVHLVALGFLLYRSRYVPRAIGALLVAAGIGYVVDSLARFFVAGHGGLASALLLASAVAGELGLTAWLLLRGINVRPDAAKLMPAAPV